MRATSRKGFKDKRSKYFVVDDKGRLVPVKKALRELIKKKKRRVKLTKSDFTTQDAIRKLKGLGFKVFKIEEV